MRHLFCWAGLALAATSACSDDDPNDLPPGNDPLALENLEAEQAKLLCQAVFRCTDAGNFTEARLVFQDANECTRYLNSAETFSLGDLRKAVAAGLVRYDGAAARRCLNSLNASCDPLGLDGAGNSADCRQVFQGTVAGGGACQISEECAEGGWCAATSTTTGTCPGRCTAALAQGAECSSSAQCSSAGVNGVPVCHYAQEGQNFVGRCRARRKGDPAPVGQACGYDPAMGIDTPCASGSHCANKVCRAVVATGAACNPEQDECTAGEVCRPSAAGMGPTCGPIQLQRTAGATCDELVTYCNPLVGLTCEAGSCAMTRPPGGAQGNGCSEGDFAAPCNAGLYCAGADQGSKTCQPKVAIGEVCDDSDACADGSCESGRCAARACQTY